jgi:hypothetical protein
VPAQSLMGTGPVERLNGRASATRLSRYTESPWTGAPRRRKVAMEAIGMDRRELGVAGSGDVSRDRHRSHHRGLDTPLAGSTAPP